jgi:hypothetical protein
MISTMAEYSERLLEAMAAAGYDKTRLHRALGVSYQAVKKATEGGKFGTTNHLAAAKLLGVSPDWLESGRGDRTPKSGGANHEPQLAHGMSQPQFSIETIRSMLWEELMGLKLKGELPPLCQVAAPDNAMAPRLRQGVRATFERDLAPQFGDGVLIKDSAGELHIRYYRRGRPGTWEAHAESEDYAPLLSDRDGIEIWAVLTGVEGRWA